MIVPVSTELGETITPGMSADRRHGSGDVSGDRERLGRFGWALFEWARNPYAILIVIYVFAPYFTQTLVGDPVRGQALLGMGASAAGVIVALLAPVLGSIADCHGRRKPWLGILIGIMAPLLLMLWFAKPGDGGLPVVVILALTIVTSICYEFTQVFHNAMLPSVARPGGIGTLSGLGLALGNLAGLLLMSAVLVLTQLSGVENGLTGRVVGPLAAIWLVVFSLPLFLFTPDAVTTGLTVRQAVVSGIGKLVATVRGLREHRQVAVYLLARMLFNDGALGILTFGGVYASGTFGWDASTMLVFGIITSIVAFGGGLVGGWLDDRLGSKRTLIIALAITIAGWICALSFQPDRIFYVIPVEPGRPIWNGPMFRTLPEVLYFLNNQIFGVVLTVTFSSSRSLLAKMAPPGMVTQMFGLYALSGSATGFIAPLMVGAVTLAFASQRAGVASLILLLGAGLIVLLLVSTKSAALEGARA